MKLIFEEKNTLGGGWSIDVKRLSKMGKNHSRVKNGTHKEGKIFPLIQGYIKKSMNEVFNYYPGESFPPTLNLPELTDSSLDNLKTRLQNGEGSSNINFNVWS